MTGYGACATDQTSNESRDGLQLDELTVDDVADLVAPVPERAVSSPMMVFLIVGEMLGIGVLSLPMAYARLGLIPGTIANVGLFFLSTYTGLLIFNARCAHPDVRSFPALFKRVLGGTAQRYASLCVYTIMFIYCAGFVVVQANSIQNFFGTLSMGTATALAALFSLLVLQAKTMPNVAVMSFAGIATIAIPLAMTFVTITDMVSNQPELYPRGPVRLFGNSTTDYFLGLMAFVWSYSGHSIYLELIAEMTEPSDFPKVLWSTQTVVLSVYTCVAVFVYCTIGHSPWLQSPFTLSLRPGVVKDTVQLLIIVHTSFGMMVYGTILIRAVQHRAESLLKLRLRRSVLFGAADDALSEDSLPKIDPPTSRSIPATLWWNLWTTLVVLAAAIVVLYLPMFDEIIALGASLVASQINIIWPALFDNLLFVKTREGLRYTGRRLLNFAVMLVGMFVLVAGVSTNFLQTGRVRP